MSNYSDEAPLLPVINQQPRDGRTSEQSFGASPDPHFKPVIKLLTVSNSLLSMIISDFLIVIYLWIRVGPFNEVANSQAAVKDLAICLIVNLIVSTPAIFTPFPVVISIVLNFIMMIVLFIYSTLLLERGWPSLEFCQPMTEKCTKGMDIIKLSMGISAGGAVFVGLIYASLLLVRVTSIAKARKVTWNLGD